MSDWQTVSSDTAECLQSALETLKQRGGVYRDNHQRVGAVMAALFPEGVTPRTQDDHEKLSLLMLIAVKLTRYAVEWERGGHQDSIHDAIVYCAMLEARTL